MKRNERMKKLKTSIVQLSALIILLVAPIPVLAQPPVNDDRNNATVISVLPFEDIVDTNDATEINDPSTNCSSGAFYTVWYTLTAKQSGTVIADTFGSIDTWTGYPLDTVLAVYDSSNEEITCNDDIDRDKENFLSQVSFTLAAGQEVYFMVGGDPGYLHFHVNGNVLESLPGRMTGGGSVFTSDGLRVTHGFELHCNANQMPNNLQVSWDKGNKFHLESLTTVSCSDDSAVEPNPPAAGFDTYRGVGTGRFNGVSGATAEWNFTDAGEPGKNDFAEIVIKDAKGKVVLSVFGNLKSGNHQAHKQ